MKKIFVLLLTVFSHNLQAQTVKVAAAGNLRFILEEIKTKYSLVNPEAYIAVNLGSSGALVQQITNGADFDLFMAADKINPERLKSQGMVKGDVKTYAFGKLVIWSNTVDVSKGMEIITENSVKRIAIAKPEVAPYGARAVECLMHYNLFDKVKDKIVYADNIAQTAQFALTGNAEIGFIALALAMAPEMKGSYFVLDTNSYNPVEQAMVLMKSPQSNPEATRFMDFILSAECTPIFEKYGYKVPKHE
jgi:molybdate transport system substrate-binding protein